MRFWFIFVSGILVLLYASVAFAERPVSKIVLSGQASYEIIQKGHTAPDGVHQNRWWYEVASSTTYQVYYCLTTPERWMNSVNVNYKFQDFPSFLREHQTSCAPEG